MKSECAHFIRLILLKRVEGAVSIFESVLG